MIKRYPREYFVRRTERLIQRRITTDRYSRQNMVRNKRFFGKSRWVPYKQRPKVTRPFTHHTPECNMFCTARGYPGATIFNSHIGTWCGYLGIPRAHILFGRKPDEVLPFLNNEHLSIGDAMKRGPIAAFIAMGRGQINTIDMAIDTHGGITYHGLGPWYPTTLNNVAWYGFDCAHCGDGKSPLWLAAQIEKYREQSPALSRIYQEELDGNGVHGVFRTEPYVRAQIEKMADQFYMLGKLIPKHSYFRKAR